MESERNTMFLNMKTSHTAEPILAMAFVNMQPLDRLYSLEDAFTEGTLFENLNKPYLGGNADEQ